MANALDAALFPTFLAVLDAGRISAAAKSLHLSQPAVTAQIRKLEATLGAALFVRSARGVAPTAAGERFAGYARSVQRLVEEAASAVTEAEEPSGELVLSASTTIAGHVLPRLLAGFRALRPRVALRLDVGNTEHVLAALTEGRISLGLVEGHSRAAGVRLEPFVDDELVAISAPSSRFRVRTVRDLGDVPLLFREVGSGTRSVLDRALRSAGIRRKALAADVELGSTEAILGAAAAGLGLAFVSRWSMQAHLASGKVIIVPGLGFSVRRTFYWAIPTGGLRGVAAQFHAFAVRSPPVLA
jgi:DNA-binding transcriptional LysR family regulator